MATDFMRKATLLLFFVTYLGLASKAQQKYLCDIVFNHEYRNSEGLMMNIDYWYFGPDIFDQTRISKEYTSAGARIKVFNQNSAKVTYQLLTGNQSGYKSQNPNDSLIYVFDKQNIDESTLRRKILINEKYYRADTFYLKVIDTLLLNNYRLSKRVFGKDILKDKKSLKIYVLKSIDSSNSLMLHFWVEQIGVVKLTNEKYWRCSFEMKDTRTKDSEKLFSAIMNVIKSKYKDPNWKPDKFYPD
ncbi:hypothetical protein KXQ82_16550 [Mucilaginibacter sp. HMF5004]|uniref:hypothetical protein n=1 Tax=Mucilaginibacter rivuli TaxID=2857527 RepID=UPI001C5E2761|nr:hypothetical protein [Mucilaginibacter rivuli]MBW4891340.1 hypothetical protein [Mucilaginibacter rivuli]